MRKLVLNYAKPSGIYSHIKCDHTVSMGMERVSGFDFTNVL
jgi:hypothetical protein